MTIIDEEQSILRAGAIANTLRAYACSLIVPNMSYVQVIKKLYEKIRTYDASVRFAFPPQLAINEVAAHFLPDLGQDIIFSNELISVDVGVSVNGFIGDCATTIDLSGKNANLVQAAQAGLDAAKKKLKVGITLGEVGNAINNAIEERGFTTIKNLSGHGLGQYAIHTKPTIPNYDNNSQIVLTPNMHFAIEPFATKGKTGLIYESGNATIFSFIKKVPTRNPHTKLILKKIETFEGLPFSIHELLDSSIPVFKIHLAMRELLLSEAISAHPPLVDRDNQLVAQAEDTVYIDQNGKIIITTLLSENDVNIIK